MEYREFTVTMKERVVKSISELEEVKLEVFPKNNGKEKIGLIIKEKTVNAAPCIYLESYYTRWNDGESMDQLIKEIFELYQEYKCVKDWDIESIKNYKLMKNKVAIKVVNYEKNMKSYEDIPYRRFLDLALVFYLFFEQDEKEFGSVMIRNEFLDMWGISEEQLYRDGLENTPRLLPELVQSMNTLFHVEQKGEEKCQGALDLQILSNERLHLGAATILYPKVLEKLGHKFQDDFYVLPSSIHEVILVGAKSALPREELDQMISEINKTQVLEEEVLSDHAYYYSRKSQRLLY